ncbi:MFS transporter [Couchioplanes caeruleus]|uniref:MFS transporter n=2 Tax=Couchioplanes caeruleus TaxID=56438 RepID=A0A1K0G646_9ACTN|nr:MFS transporter [Couchioplanes caeruleus]OJF12746.1 MFS transporter [Couchioplanes caeruleus subsp. caeruleus]ROP30638.1 putative MFS family arabinose efflux permease [Couchioplanes caeruleus]
MPLLPTIGRTVGTGVKAMRMLVRGGLRGSAWATRRVGDARARGAAGEIGMIRLFDLHALSCAGDTLIAIGLAGTIFFNVPLGEARSKVALYLLITMVPFALLAPVVGPLLDHFRHGRRYALATAMLGRAFLAYVISDNLLGWGLYPAAFGVLALSRAYGVARSAAVPRLLPEGVGLSQVGARASVYGTFAGAVVAPIGLLAFKIGPQWPLRVSSVIFLVGMVIALRLPPRADSDPPEEVPRPFRTVLRLRRGPDRPLSGSLVVGTLIGSASFRCLYGFLLLYLAFAVKAQGLGTDLFGRDIGSQGAVALVGGALAVGTFLATAIGTRLRIRRPAALQSSGLTITAAVAVLTALFFTLPMVALLCLVASVFSGISKLAVDASIQERVPERLRASAFAHSETVLMIAWVIGGAVGIIPLDGRLGIAVAALFALAAAIRGTIVATRLRGERLHGRPDLAAEDTVTVEQPATTGEPPTQPIPTGPGASPPPAPPHPAGPPTPHPASRPVSRQTAGLPTSPHPASPPTPPHAAGLPTSPPSEAPAAWARQSGAMTPDGGAMSPDGGAMSPDGGRPTGPREHPPTAPASGPPAPPLPRKPTGRRRRLFSRSSATNGEPLPTQPSEALTPPMATPGPAPDQPSAPEQPRDDDLAPPGFHIYRPSSATSGDSSQPDEAGR